MIHLQGEKVLEVVLVVIFLISREFSFTFCFFSVTLPILPMADRHSGLTARRSSSDLVKTDFYATFFENGRWREACGILQREAAPLATRN